MQANKPDGVGWWYKVGLDSKGNPVGEYSIAWVQRLEGRSRLVYVVARGMGWEDADSSRDTYWQRVPSPSWVDSQGD